MSKIRQSLRRRVQRTRLPDALVIPKRILGATSARPRRAQQEPVCLFWGHTCRVDVWRRAAITNDNELPASNHDKLGELQGHIKSSTISHAIRLKGAVIFHLMPREDKCLLSIWHAISTLDLCLS